MADREQMSIGQLVVTDRISVEKVYTVAAPPSNPKTGDVARFSDGAAGAFALCIYDGTNWKVISAATTAAVE